MTRESPAPVRFRTTPLGSAMLKSTFVHIPGIGPTTETRILSQGIRTWEDFLGRPGPVLGASRDPLIRRCLQESLAHEKDLAYFSARLKAREMWRVFEAFRDRAVYLDIETTGGTQGVDEITVIGLFDGNRVETFVNGRNLAAFEIRIADFDLVVTFNGASFDLPFIRRVFPGISLPPGHIDLRVILRQLGYRGGLKRIEKDLGLTREEGIAGMDGFDAVRLWQEHLWGDPHALPTLIRYNTADIVNLEPLMERAFQEMRRRRFRDPR